MVNMFRDISKAGTILILLLTIYSIVGEFVFNLYEHNSWRSYLTLIGGTFGEFDFNIYMNLEFS